MRNQLLNILASPIVARGMAALARKSDADVAYLFTEYKIKIKGCDCKECHGKR